MIKTKHYIICWEWNKTRTNKQSGKILIFCFFFNLSQQSHSKKKRNEVKKYNKYTTYTWKQWVNRIINIVCFTALNVNGRDCILTMIECERNCDQMVQPPLDCTYNHNNNLFCWNQSNLRPIYTLIIRPTFHWMEWAELTLYDDDNYWTC